MSEHLSDKQIDQLIADYLAGSLSEADRPAFEAWLRASPDHPRRVARLSVTDYALHELSQDTKADYLLDILNQIDDAAGPAQLVTLHNFQQPIWHRYRLPMALGGAIAAVLVIAITLIITLSGPSTDPASIAGNTPSEPGRHGPAHMTTVATLTATHNAQWDSQPAEDLRRGSNLHPNQRLTLTAGFAEITTHDGAVAILEAPATIELINTNALRLHTGKLVGVCETESSKGFVVRTQHMGVTDLGTRFGVEVTHEGTRAHVFEGDIAVHASDALDFDQATRLGVGESAITEAGKSIVITTNRPGLTFVRDWAAATNAPRVTGPIRYTASVPTALDFDQREADDHILLLSEHNGLRLSKDIPVSKAELLDGHRFRADSTVPAGTVVDTYLLHGDIVGDDPDKGINFRGSIRFDRPILGVIANGIDLSQSHRVLGLKGVFYPGMQVTQIVAENAGLEKSLKDKMFDGFQISEDRRTLSVGFDCGGSMDQMRVLILADEATPTN